MAPNYSAIISLPSILLRPGLLLPHISVPDINHLDWKALKNVGIKSVVFDKDNCLTEPLIDQIAPHLENSVRSCIDTFGWKNVVILSNSSGSSDDPGGLGAESLSRSLLQNSKIQVMLHENKKPSKSCAKEVVKWSLSNQFSSNSLGPRILMVGDRSTTDVVTGHRISEILDGRIKDQELGQRDSASDGGSSGKGDGCLTVLTTGIHKSEKLGTRFMRGVEYKLIKHFLKRGIRPGAKGWKKSDESEMMSLKPRGIEKVGLSLGLVSSKNRWQSLAVKSSSNTTSSTSASNVTLTLNPQELSPSTKLQKPSLTHFILPIFPSKLQPYLLQFFNLSSVWPIKPVLTLMGECWDLILKGVKIGVRLQMPNGNSRKRDALEIGDISEKRFGSINRRDTVIGNSRNSFRNGSGSNARSFSSTSFLTKSSSCKSNSISSSNSTSTSRFSRLPSKNWLAALSALILVPVCYLLGAGLHEYRSEKAALKEEERMRNLNLGLNEREILEMKEKREGEELEGRRKSEERDRGERRKSLELAHYHLTHERAEVLGKLERLRERREEEASRGK